MRLSPPGWASLSLVSTLEVALLEAIAAQDLHLVRLRRLDGERWRRRRALVLAPAAAPPGRLTGGSRARRRVLLRDRGAAHEIGRVGALGGDRLGVRPAPQRQHDPPFR